MPLSADFNGFSTMNDVDLNEIHSEILFFRVSKTIVFFIVEIEKIPSRHHIALHSDEIDAETDDPRRVT